MTDLDKQAANAEVARAIHGELTERWCYYSECGISECEEGLTEEEINEELGIFKRLCYSNQHPHCTTWTPIPDLFAHSAAGALALLEAEEWLLNTRKFDYSNVTRYGEGLPHKFGVDFESDGSIHTKEGLGATLAEARATAICNAVRGMREDKNG